MTINSFFWQQIYKFRIPLYIKISNISQSQQLMSKIDTSQVVVETDGDKTTYYLPSYVRFLIKQIDAVDIAAIEANMSGTLLFAFYYGSIDSQIIDTFIGEQATKSIVMEFNQEESIELKEEKGLTLKIMKQKNMAQFTIRKSFKTDVKGKMFLAPFMTLNLYILVTLQSLNFKIGKKQYTIKFNCMDTKQILLLRHGQNLSFGTNQIAPYQFDVKYSYLRKFPFEADDTIVDNTDVEDQESLKYFQYAHFKVGVFRYPLISLLKVFVPLWILGLMGLFLFFQEQSFASRLTNISVIALAYVGLIEPINNNIPASPTIKLTEILILLEILATILLLIQSFDIRQVTPFEFIWYQSGYFIASIAINLFTFIVITTLYIHHRCVSEPLYMTKNPDNAYRKKQKSIDRSIWRNKQCDDYFNNYIERNCSKNDGKRQFRNLLP